MKKGIHPKYDKCVVKCVCGNTFETRSTTSAIDIEVCSACHPVYTGKKKIVDSTGRVERYEERLKQKQRGLRTKKEKKIAKARKRTEARTETAKAEDKKA